MNWLSSKTSWPSTLASGSAECWTRAAATVDSFQFWADQYEKVDMFDQSEVARGMVKDRIKNLKLREYASVLRSSFIDFPW